jgi:hypothetical protein
VKTFRFSLFTRMTWLAGSLALVSIGMAQVYFARHERTALIIRMSEKASFVTNFYAFLIADALQRNDDVTLLQVINRLEEDPEIASVIVVDQSGNIRYHADPEKIDTPLEDPLLTKAFESGDGVASQLPNNAGMTLICPLKIRGQTKSLGAVRIEFTYQHINQTVRSGQASFQMVALGILSLFVGGIHWGFRRWVVVPLSQLKASLGLINPANLQGGLPESNTEFGEVNKSINHLLTRIRAEWDNQRSRQVGEADTERRWVERLAISFIPDVRILAADRDNRILTDTGSPEQAPGTVGTSAIGSHLLDLISDEAFATLMTGAFQKEGEVVHGIVTFQKQPYHAAIIRIPEPESRIVKTVIGLRHQTAP